MPWEWKGALTSALYVVGQQLLGIVAILLEVYTHMCMWCMRMHLQLSVAAH